MITCVDADFERARVPADARGGAWRPADAPDGWHFGTGAGLANTTSTSWRGPRAVDGTQVAVLQGSAARVAQTIRGWEPGTEYHLRWSEAGLPRRAAAPLALQMHRDDGRALTDIAARVVATAHGWRRLEAVFRATAPTLTILFRPRRALRGTRCLLDSVRLWRTPAVPPDTFPRFAAPGFDAEMARLRELFFLHYASGRIGATFSMHWVAESVLWPALETCNDLNQRAHTRRQLMSRTVSPDGYVACHQHAGLGHPEGWPFPLWWQSQGVGWHFAQHAIDFFSPSITAAGALRTDGMQPLAADAATGVRWRVTAARACIEFPTFAAHAMVTSYFILDWLASAAPAGAQCFLEWRSQKHPAFANRHRVRVDLATQRPRHHQEWLALRDQPDWQADDTLTGVRLILEQAAGAVIDLWYLCSAVDTRHNVNNALYIDACHSYATWSGDHVFLRSELPRMRTAMRYALRAFNVARHHCVHTPWLGHDGTSGIHYDAKGRKTIRYGCGIGNNYWDLLPFGGKDTYATVYLYSALLKLAALEDAAAQHREWAIHAPPSALAPARLRALAHALQQHNRQFWNRRTGRFAAAVDAEGAQHDYGLTFLNCEAVHYGFATPRQAERIMQWLEGTRLVTGDTSTGADIYHWEFGPRATTRRNIAYYTYPWSNPEDIPFGGQVQDGGAVLGFTYHDLMTRLRTRGPDNAWQRLREILNWFARVQDEGGYRQYYYGGTTATRGTLQGGGTAGGLGCDHEFLESVLVPQIMLYGFMGMQPHMDGLTVAPHLPRAWPALTISNIRLHNTTFDLAATRTSVRMHITGGADALQLFLPRGTWDVAYHDAPDNPRRSRTRVVIGRAPHGIPLRMHAGALIVCTRGALPRPCGGSRARP